MTSMMGLDPVGAGTQQPKKKPTYLGPGVDPMAAAQMQTPMNSILAKVGQVAKAQQNALVPDNYSATLQAIARARTQRMQRDTNGISGSMLGIA